MDRSTIPTPHLDDSINLMGFEVNWFPVHCTQVETDEFMNFDWEEEESLLRRKDGDDRCLSMHLDRLKLRCAEDFDE